MFATVEAVTSAGTELAGLEVVSALAHHVAPGRQLFITSIVGAGGHIRDAPVVQALVPPLQTRKARRKRLRSLLCCPLTLLKLAASAPISPRPARRHQPRRTAGTGARTAGPCAGPRPGLAAFVSAGTPCLILPVRGRLNHRLAGLGEPGRWPDRPATRSAARISPVGRLAQVRPAASLSPARLTRSRSPARDRLRLALSSNPGYRSRRISKWLLRSDEMTTGGERASLAE